MVARALTVHIPGVSGFGFFWERATTTSGHVIWRHGGMLAGVSTRVAIDPATKEGVVILMNGNTSVADPHIYAIEDRVFETLDAM